MRLLQHIGNLNRLLCSKCTPQRSRSGWPDYWVAPPFFNKRLGGAMYRNGAERITFGSKQHPELCLAEPRRVGQNSFEHGLKFSLRAGDDLQYLGGRALLLQRLAQLPPGLVKLALKKRDSCFLHAARRTRTLRCR
jgi:hypothetical protein